MRFITARQAWHDAFDGHGSANDFEEIGGNSTVKGGGRRRTLEVIRDEDGKITGRILAPIISAIETRVGKGSAARIMDDVERGMVQNVVHRLRKSDPLAWCWGMAAYAPPNPRVFERAALLQYLMSEFDKWEEPHERTKVSRLAFHLIQACADRDWNARRIDLRHARVILGVDKAAWDRDWKRIWQRLQRRLDPLPGRALGPVAELVEDYKERCREAC